MLLALPSAIANGGDSSRASLTVRNRKGLRAVYLNAQKLCVDGLGWMGMEISVSTSSKSTAVLITSWNVKWIWTADIEFDPDSIRVEHNINTAMPILFLDHVINKVVKVTVQCS